jgi:hypothetical protein
MLTHKRELRRGAKLHKAVGSVPTLSRGCGPLARIVVGLSRPRLWWSVALRFQAPAFSPRLYAARLQVPNLQAGMWVCVLMFSAH